MFPAWWNISTFLGTKLKICDTWRTLGKKKPWKFLNLLCMKPAGWWWEQAQCSEPDVLLEQHHRLTVTMFLSQLFYFWHKCKIWNLFLCRCRVAADPVQKETLKTVTGTWNLQAVMRTGSNLSFQWTDLILCSEQQQIWSQISLALLFSVCCRTLSRSEISRTSNKERLSAAICSFPKRGLRVKRVRV